MDGYLLNFYTCRVFKFFCSSPHVFICLHFPWDQGTEIEICEAKF